MTNETLARTRRSLGLLALAASITLSFGHAAAAQCGAPANAPASVRVEFHPPLGKTFRYRVVKSAQPGPPGSAVELEQELSFQEIAAGYLLQIRTMKVVRDGRTFTPDAPYSLTIPADDMISLIAPITLRLGTFGRVFAVHDWDVVRERIRAIPDQLAPQLFPESRREEARSRISSGLQGIIALSDQGAWTVVAKDWPPMLTYGGATFEVGKTVTTRNTYYPFDGETPVDLVHDVVAQPTSDGGLTLTEIQHADTEQFATAMAKYAAKSPLSAADEAERQKGMARMREFNRVSTTHVQLDRDGVLLNGYWEVRMERDGTVGESTKVSFERLD